MESALAIKDLFFHRKDGGQVIMIFALLLPVMALFMVGVLDYMVTNARAMEVVAAADLAAHAGAQEITVLPDGTLVGLPQGESAAESYFRIQAPSGAQYLGASCGVIQGQPACQVEAQMATAGYLIPQRQIRVNAIGYLAQGVTRGGQ